MKIKASFVVQMDKKRKAEKLCGIYIRIVFRVERYMRKKQDDSLLKALLGSSYRAFCSGAHVFGVLNFPTH